MINLLPPSTKQSILYARKNRTLLRWIVATSIGVVGIGVVVLAGHFYINYSTTAYAKEVEQNKTLLASQKVDETKKRVEDISNSVKLVNQVLNREVKFSKLLQGIGAAMPPGAALQNFSITKLGGAIDLQVVAVDYQTATQVQVNLQDPANKIFEKADIVNIGCATVANGNDPNASRYPCQVTLRALFAKNSPYLVTSPSAGVKK